MMKLLWRNYQHLFMEVLIKVDFATLTRIRRVSSELNSFVETHRTLLAHRRFKRHYLKFTIEDDHLKIEISFNAKGERFYVEITDPLTQFSALGFYHVHVISNTRVLEHLTPLYKKAVEIVRLLRPSPCIVKVGNIPKDDTFDILSIVRKVHRASLLLEEADHQSLVFHPTIQTCSLFHLVVADWHSSFPIHKALDLFARFEHVDTNLPYHDTRKGIYSILWDVFRLQEKINLKSLCINFDGEGDLLNEDATDLPPIKTLWELEEIPAEFPQTVHLHPVRLHLLKSEKVNLLICENRFDQVQQYITFIFIEKSEEDPQIVPSSSWLRFKDTPNPELNFDIIERSEFIRTGLPEQSLWPQIFSSAVDQ